MTPAEVTTERVRSKFATVLDDVSGWKHDETWGHDFDRWLAAHDAAVAAKAWDEGYAVGEDNFIHSDYCGTRGCQCQGLHGTTNPYLTKEAESGHKTGCMYDDEDES